MSTYRILTLDGGGFRGVLSAIILQAVEESLQAKFGPEYRLNEYFDLVSGTSTGSILAAGIALGMEVKTLLALYKQHGARIFPARIRNTRKFTNFTRGFFPAFLYPHVAGDQGLAVVLQEQLQATKQAILKDTYKPGKPVTIQDIKKPILLIPAFNTEKRRLDWFVSNNDEQSLWYDNTEVWKFCVCSASAPTFFPPYLLETQGNNSTRYTESYIDGGIAANNPSLIALAHARFGLEPTQTKFGRSLDLDEISILSIGTGRPTNPLSYQEVKSWGLAQWAMRLGDLFLPAPNDVTSQALWQLIRGNDPRKSKRILRLDFNVIDNEEGKQLQQIDNPDLYEMFVKVATNYLNSGQVPLDIGKSLNPREAIRQFVEDN
jgi:patatin-like phospholipase/acyl hydrolase